MPKLKYYLSLVTGKPIAAYPPMSDEYVEIDHETYSAVIEQDFDLVASGEYKLVNHSRKEKDDHE